MADKRVKASKHGTITIQSNTLTADCPSNYNKVTHLSGDVLSAPSACGEHCPGAAAGAAVHPDLSLHTLEQSPQLQPRIDALKDTQLFHRTDAGGKFNCGAPMGESSVEGSSPPRNSALAAETVNRSNGEQRDVSRQGGP